jgi:sialate O-acetylesterase
MIAPIANMTIKGVIWYQGETDTGASYSYRDIFPTMIKNWRCDFNNLAMPFYFVQLASFTTHRPGVKVDPYRGQPRDDGLAELREAQLMTNSLKNTGMAVTIDIGETNNVHPGNKKDVGERLARWALAKDYEKNIDYSGPLYAGYRIEGDKIRIVLNYAESGLVFKDGEAKGFAIAGTDRKFVWADAQIDGTTIIVSSENVKKPVAVRYAWDCDPENCLYNKANLPASPFRTDDWNGVTFGNK